MNRIQLEHIIRAAAGNADAILIDGAIGERSLFHETFGYYAHGVGEDTALLPAGWRDRLVAVCNANTRGATGWCLEVHDLSVSKLAAGREKDLAYVSILLQHQFVDADVLRKRLAQTAFASTDLQSLAVARLERLALSCQPATVSNSAIT